MPSHKDCIYRTACHHEYVHISTTAFIGYVCKKCGVIKIRIDGGINLIREALEELYKE